MNDSHLFKLARDESLKADYRGCASAKLGCIVALKNTVIARGCNSNKTHTKQEYYNKYRYKKDNTKYLPSKLHAEVAALSKIQYLDVDFSKVEIYIYRELKDGSTAMARPCPSCLAAIKDIGIKKIHYTTPDGFATEIIKEKNNGF